MTTKVDKTIEVDVPISTAYNQWTQFESFPEFMGGVTEVKQLSDQRLHWVAEIAGVKREWDAKIVDQIPDTKVAWVATEGATNAGAVYFESLGLGRTLVRLSLEYEPEGLVEKAGDALNIVEKRAEGDLENFKKYIESRRHETGAWRGDIAEAPGVGTPGAEDADQTRGDSGKAGVSGKAVAAGLAAAGAAAAGVAAAGAAKKSGSDKERVETVEVRPAAPVTPVTTVTPSSDASADVDTADTAKPVDASQTDDIPAEDYVTKARTDDAVFGTDADVKTDTDKTDRS